MSMEPTSIPAKGMIYLVKMEPVMVQLAQRDRPQCGQVRSPQRQAGMTVAAQAATISMTGPKTMGRLPVMLCRQRALELRLGIRQDRCRLHRT